MIAYCNIGGIGDILVRYTQLEPDFTDGALMWCALDTDCRAILTVDVRDFNVFRIGKSKRFDIVKWF